MFYKKEDLKLVNYLTSELKDDNLRYELINLFEFSKVRCDYYLEEIICVDVYILKSLLIEYMENQTRFIIHKSYNPELDLSEKEIHLLAKYGIYHKNNNIYEQFPQEELERFFKQIK